MNHGIVIKTTGSWHTVKDGDKIIPCKIRGRFREKELTITNPVAVGDRVRYETDRDGAGLIIHIEPRKNYIIRRSSNLSKEAHILAANLDQAFLMITLAMPETPLEFADRFLLAAEAYHIPVILLINKTDLLSGESLSFLHSVTETYRSAAYACMEISVKTGKGMEAVVDSMKDKTSLLAGNSGVGKSTLINRICPEINFV